MNDSLDPYDLVGAAREAAELLKQLVDKDRDLIGPTQARLDQAIALAAPLSKEIMTPGQLAEEWHVNVSTVRGWIEDGDLEAFDAGRGSIARWRILRPNILRFAELRANRSRPRIPHQTS